MSDDVHYANIREVLGDFIGLKVVDISQHDKSDWEETHESCIWLHFEDGRSLRFVIGDAGYDVEEP